MLPPKDRFSAHAQQYAQFRPDYPDELYTYIYSRTKNFDLAWDCATGNGQVALQLAHKFKQVYATDISQKQLNHATPNSHIQYTIARAEQTAFQNQQFDLITDVTQTIPITRSFAFLYPVLQMISSGPVIEIGVKK